MVSDKKSTQHSDRPDAGLAAERQMEEEKDPYEVRIQGWRDVINGVLTRADGQDVIFRPFGMEMTLSSFLRERYHLPEYNALASHIKQKYILGKRVLVLPAYSTNPFLFKKIGAKEVVGVDADATSIQWQQVIQEYFNRDSIGDAFLSLVRFPNGHARTELSLKLQLQKEEHGHVDLDKYIKEKIQEAAFEGEPPAPLEGVEFHQAVLGRSEGSKIQDVKEAIPEAKRNFDFTYVPFLLGIKNGIETEEGVRKAFDELWELGHDGSGVMIVPWSGSEDGVLSFGVWKVISELKNLMPKDKFDIEEKFHLMGSECAILKIKK